MGDNMVLTDGMRSVELYQITGNTHHDGIVMAYLRKKRSSSKPMLFTGSGRRGAAQGCKSICRRLEANVRRLNIDVERIVPIHGRIVPYSELLAAIGKKPAPAKN